MTQAGTVQRRRGRAQVTDRGELGRIGLDLMIERGFDAVSVEDIASAAGIARRTYFSYFSSKSEVVWGDFDGLLARFRADLDGTDTATSAIESIREAVRRFNRIPDAEIVRHRRRMRMIIETPQLVAHSAVRYADWRAVIVDYLARRERVARSSVVPVAVSWACLGVSMAAYEQWVAEPDADLATLIDEAFRGLRDAFAEVLDPDPAQPRASAERRPPDH
ncbi:mycofactocin system transcriptional regulator [Agromyces tropicus]|uniref:Mycofactocin system transcriptional regulator n=1 Tax=Agromyces tropicus TaxID=555371 RepID=A0ABN2U339_9MICO